MPGLCQHIYTLAIVLFGWVIFRIEDFSLMGSWAAALAGLQGLGQPLTLNTMNLLHLFPWFFIAAIASTPHPARLVKSVDGRPFWGWAGDAALACMLVLCVVSLAVNEFNPFIYFRF